MVAVAPAGSLERLRGEVRGLGAGVGEPGSADGEQLASPGGEGLEQRDGFGEAGGLDGLLEGSPALEGGGVAGGEQLPDVFLDAPRDGELDVLVEDLL